MRLTKRYADVDFASRIFHRYVQMLSLVFDSVSQSEFYATGWIRYLSPELSAQLEYRYSPRGTESATIKISERSG
jgi:hypothetical protein